MNLMRAPTDLLFLLVGILATIEVRREGWLDRVVSHQKMKFLKDVKALVPIKAAIIPKPVGYVDSKDWTYDSVMHLIVLLRASETAAPVNRALRRAMKPTRRMIWGMKMSDTFSHFPSLSKASLNEFYYDVGSAEDYEDAMGAGEPAPAESGVIVVYNPVEAKLPSSQISIELLKEIMIQRAIAARKMPPTPVTQIPWEPMNATNSTGGAAGGAAPANGTDSANSTEASTGDAAAEDGGATADPAAENNDAGTQENNSDDPNATVDATTDADADAGGGAVNDENKVDR